MSKTILLTGATDGIGLEVAKKLVSLDHTVLIHGRNSAKLADVEKMLAAQSGGGQVESYVADLSKMCDVEALAKAVTEKHDSLDVLINNAGVFKLAEPIMANGMDLRFVVNTFAPYLLTQRLLPLMDSSSRVVNLSSAAQAPVNLDAMAGRVRIADDFGAYAQSKLAITAWSHALAQKLGDGGPAIIAVNPGSMLSTKMVKEAFGGARQSVDVGVDILTRAALSDEFVGASGKYFDNDSGRFASPHPDALDPQRSAEVVRVVEEVLAELA